MRALGILLAVSVAAHGHTGQGRNRRPTKAAPQIKQTRDRIDRMKTLLAAKGRYGCCAKPSCDLCALRNGSCGCAVNLGKGAGVCGQCQALRTASTAGSPEAGVPVLDSARQALPGGPAPELTVELEEIRAMLLGAKRIMVAEGRYACCVKGGCAECALEGECQCGGRLAQGKGICGSCLDGWHAGEGLYEGIALADLKLEPMEQMTDREGMAPAAPGAGWYLSGTSQTPAASPMFMTQRRAGAWTVGGMGQAHAAYTAQSSPRGGDKIFSTNWFMPMAWRRAGGGTLTVRSMFSLEPATVTGGRYPLLFQTGETHQGRPIVDGQHPHSFLMELGAAYSRPLGERTSLNLYGGARGEPAFGPGGYAHRLSQSENPMAVLGHHYQDSTHIAGNVATAGVTHGRVTLEGSGFLGREPGEARWRLERGGIDSWSARVTVTPSARWLAQFSYASLTSPEAREPHVNATRMSGSATYVRPLGRGHWASTVLWGAHRKQAHDGEPAAAFHSYLAESTALSGNNWVWGRFELTDKDGTLAFRGEAPVGQVAALTLGYARELNPETPWFSAALGGQVTLFRAPEALRGFYGRSAAGAQVFLRFRVRN